MAIFGFGKKNKKSTSAKKQAKLLKEEEAVYRI
jgi:hypothetical protein